MEAKKTPEDEVFDDPSYDEGHEESDSEEAELSELDREMLQSGEIKIVGFKWVNQKCDVKFHCVLASGVVAKFGLEGSQVPPHEELVVLLESLKEDLAREAEVPFRQKNPIIVTQISTGSKNGKNSYKILGLYGRADSNNPMNISSDLKWDKHNDKKQELDSETVYKIKQVLEQVNVYVKSHFQPVDGPDLFGNPAPTLLEKSGANLNGATPETVEAKPEVEDEDPF